MTGDSQILADWSARPRRRSFRRSATSFPRLAVRVGKLQPSDPGRTKSPQMLRCTKLFRPPRRLDPNDRCRLRLGDGGKARARDSQRAEARAARADNHPSIGSDLGRSGRRHRSELRQLELRDAFVSGRQACPDARSTAAHSATGHQAVLVSEAGTGILSSPHDAAAGAERRTQMETKPEQVTMSLRETVLRGLLREWRVRLEAFHVAIPRHRPRHKGCNG